MLKHLTNIPIMVKRTRRLIRGTLNCRIPLKSVAEELAANDYFYNISGQFDQLSEICGESTGLSISAKNTEKNFEEGYFIKDYVLHGISTLTKDEMLKSTSSFISLTNALKTDVF